MFSIAALRNYLKTVSSAVVDFCPSKAAFDQCRMTCHVWN